SGVWQCGGVGGRCSTTASASPSVAIRCSVSPRCPTRPPGLRPLRVHRLFVLRPLCRSPAAFHCCGCARPACLHLLHTQHQRWYLLAHAAFSPLSKAFASSGVLPRGYTRCAGLAGLLPCNCHRLLCVLLNTKGRTEEGDTPCRM